MYQTVFNILWHEWNSFYEQYLHVGKEIVLHDDIAIGEEVCINIFLMLVWRGYHNSEVGLVILRIPGLYLTYCIRFTENILLTQILFPHRI
jgi:hypothetical protein